MPNVEELVVGSRNLSAEELEPCPQFRTDLQIKPGPDDEDGSPTFSIFDPSKVQYYKISWREALIVDAVRPGMTIGDVVKNINRRATFKITLEGLKSFLKEAERNNLLLIKRPSEDLQKEAKYAEMGLLKWLLYHYLYIRIPLINPNTFLAKTLPWVKPLISQRAIGIYFTITLVGIFLLITHFDEFIHTFTYFFSVKGFIIYGLAVAAVKIIHEFAHAYVAKNYGVNVPSMGAAFIVMWPVLYTDVTDSWKLSKRSQRLAISAAGIVVELVIAGLCTLGWSLTEPGILQSVFFVISSVTWISTLVVNTNPAMRFDGYYLLCDLWGIDNLQPRAFALFRWQMRKWFLGLNMAPPEEVSDKQRFGMNAYACYTLIYRLGLYITVAAFVYYEFTKVLGIFLFFVEIGVFLIWPVVDELVQLQKIKPLLSYNWRSVLTVSAVAALFLWFIIPLPHYQKFSAVTIPRDGQSIFVPQDAIVKKVFVKQGSKVEVGQEIITFFSKTLEAEYKSYLMEREVLEKEAFIASNDIENRPTLAEKKAQIRTVNAQIAELAELQKEMTIKAQISGTVYKWNDAIKVDQALPKKQEIGKIANLNEMDVICYIPEAEIGDVQKGMKIAFIPKYDFTRYSGKVIQLSPVRDKLLEYPQLASTNNGSIPITKGSSDKLFIVDSYYQARIVLDAEGSKVLRFGQVGDVEIQGAWESYLVTMLRHVQTVYLRESSF